MDADFLWVYEQFTGTVRTGSGGGGGIGGDECEETPYGCTGDGDSDEDDDDDDSGGTIDFDCEEQSPDHWVCYPRT